MSYEPPTIDELQELVAIEQEPFGLLCAKNGTERDDARLFARLVAGQWLYVYDEKKWTRHVDGVWLDASHLIVTTFQQVLFEEYIKYETSKDAQNSIRRISKTKSVSASLVVCSNLLAIHSTAFDSNPLEFNLLNGVYDFRTQSFRPHNDSDRFRVQVPYNYDPKADCPFFREFLETVFLQDYDLIKWLLQRLAVCLTGEVPFEEFQVWHGSGANGKSILLSVLQMVAGGYSIAVSGELFIQKREDNSDERTLARLQGKRLAVSSELPANKRLDESRVKSLTGGDRIIARKLYSEQIEFNPTAKFIVATNEKPAISSMTEAMWRRIRLIPFLHTIPTEKRLPKAELLRQFSAELPGIFNLLIEQYTESPELPSSVVQATEEYKTENDQLSDFLGECCIIESEALSKLKDLYKKYSDWLSTNGARANYHTDKKFLTALLTVPDVEKEVRSKNVVLRGIRIAETLL